MSALATVVDGRTLSLSFCHPACLILVLSDSCWGREVKVVVVVGEIVINNVSRDGNGSGRSRGGDGGDGNDNGCSDGSNEVSGVGSSGGDGGDGNGNGRGDGCCDSRGYSSG
ncbi:hypothetical protein PoB_003475500 [Plakobranchus ocellatus]|uniref:Uncharacterized protein n=1 Tax=Plakobranchus ocellatus TaxID=259542 RepID=A0AAV4AMX0_9GAST|nr:hypothetical protein PoB_003475500 [Plakobranchus ocellatus]